VQRGEGSSRFGEVLAGRRQIDSNPPQACGYRAVRQP
jgi:hypothetical protein